jgi:hypothetical protein
MAQKICVFLPRVRNFALRLPDCTETTFGYSPAQSTAFTSPILLAWRFDGSPLPPPLPPPPPPELRSREARKPAET